MSYFCRMCLEVMYMIKAYVFFLWLEVTQVRKRQQFAGDVRNIKQNFLWYSFGGFDGFGETFVHHDLCHKGQYF